MTSHWDEESTGSPPKTLKPEPTTDGVTPIEKFLENKDSILKTFKEAADKFGPPPLPLAPIDSNCGAVWSQLSRSDLAVILWFAAYATKGSCGEDEGRHMLKVLHKLAEEFFPPPPVDP